LTREDGVGAGLWEYAEHETETVPIFQGSDWKKEGIEKGIGLGRIGKRRVVLLF
jgi:hypothetical protein